MANSLFEDDLDGLSLCPSNTVDTEATLTSTKLMPDTTNEVFTVITDEKRRSH